MRQRIGVYGVIFRRGLTAKNQPKFLIIDWGGKGGLPGGGQKNKENLERTFLREIKEELGLKKKDFRFFFKTDFKKEFISKIRRGWRKHKETHWYFVAQINPGSKIKKSPEIPGLRWCSREEAIDFLHWESTKILFQKIIETYQGLIFKG